MPTIKLTQSNFDTEVNVKDTSILVDFWAPWCGPCRMIGPMVDEIAEENTGKVKVGKVNIDDEPELAQRFGVMSIPTLILFKEGKPAGKIIGAQPKESLEELISK